MDDVKDEYPEFPPELIRQPKESTAPMKMDDVSVDVSSANGVQAPAHKAAPKAAKAAPKAAKAAKAKAAPKAAKAASKVQLDKYGLKVGSLRSKAAALYASKKGATLQEVSEKLDSSTQFNVLKELEKKGFTVERTTENGKGRRQVTRFKLI